jgi:hypothetical protein
MQAYEISNMSVIFNCGHNNILKGECMDKKWFGGSYRRDLIDMHIPDWNEDFLSLFDPEKYVEMLKLSGVDTAIIYTSSCLGICYWPTKIGHMHEGLKGRDIIKEITELCRKNNINAVVYFNIWSRWAYINHPDWRMLDIKGRGTLEYLMDPGRFGVCCPNSGYKDFVKDQISDLCINYDFKGLWIDMLGWFGVICCCPNCRKRYFEETGRQIPETINWEDPEWVMFQRKREDWITGFAEDINKIAGEIKPDISIVHQCASWVMGWLGGISSKFLAKSDYLAGDFYVDATEQSYICKMLNSNSNHRPVEFMTTRCPNLMVHTTSKTREELLAQLYSSVANSCAFVFIDAIDPAGTLNKNVYTTMGELFKESKIYIDYLVPENKLCADAAIYFNFESAIYFEDNGKRIGEASPQVPLLKNMSVMAKSLINANIAYDVITQRNLDSLKDHQAVILSDLIMISDDEAEAFRKYVRDGGCVYASGRTSLLDTDGSGNGDFILSDLFGVSYAGQTPGRTGYIRPYEDVNKEFKNYSDKYPIAVSGSMSKVVLSEPAQSLAGITLPLFDPDDTGCFSSAISDPPWSDTDLPALVMNRYGMGTVIYSSGMLEGMEYEDHRDAFIGLVKRLFQRPALLRTNAPKAVEITVFLQKQNKRYIINVLNYQKELPNIPVYDMNISLYMDLKKPIKIRDVNDGCDIGFITDDGYVEFKVPKLDTFHMLVLDYE